MNFEEFSSFVPTVGVDGRSNVPRRARQTVRMAEPTNRRAVRRARTLVAAALLALTFAFGCAEQSTPETHAAPTTAATADTPTTAPAADPAWPDIDKTLERHGVPHDGVFTITVPRDDLSVAIEGMSVPTAAGIESVFHFYRCPCGRMNVAGQFVVTDYESNDVIDALRQDATFRVASLAPMFQYENPRLLLIRFQGEGDPIVMAKTIRAAIKWTGPERMAPEKIDLPAK